MAIRHLKKNLFKIIVFTLIIILPGTQSFSQHASENKILLTKSIHISSVIQTDSGIYLIELIRGSCKSNFANFLFIATPPVNSILKQVENPTPPVTVNPFITIHGNITYNFNYKSYIDTPFAEKDVMQHSLQTRLNVNLMDKYPFTIFITSRQSNSAYFSNATDVSFQFRQADMLDDIRKKMRNETELLLYNKSLQLNPAQIYQLEKDGLLKEVGNFSTGRIKNATGQMVHAKKQATEQQFKKLYGDYKSKMDKLEVLQSWTKHSSRDQELIEEKEKKLRDKGGALQDSLKDASKDFATRQAVKFLKSKDSTFKNTSKTITDTKQAIDSLRKEIAKSEQALKSFQKKITDSLQQIRKQIAAITDKNSLSHYLQKNGESVKQLPALQRALLSVKQIGIGRSWIDYSELTVKNISLSGVNIETNPGNTYLAAAAGKVNYRFRDYIVKGNTVGSGQSVWLVRAGFGKKEKNNVIITYYAGKKALLNQRSIADSAAVQHISGISIESRLALDANNYLIGEYARSVSPNIKSKLLDMKTHTNEAWSLKLFSHYGNTKITSYYRRMGESFQSFTLYPANNRQDAWMIRVNQSFWKKMIVLDAAMRKNDFESPIAAPDFRNKNVFKSLQITAMVPKYPFVSIGYYPSSQLTLSNNNVLYENRYNTLNGIISHSYFLGKLSMNSNATYTKFYNGGSDSGFVYYNASSFALNHSINLRSFVLQAILTVTDQSLLHQITFEPAVTYRLKNKLSVSGSLKWSRVNHAETLWGGTAGLNLYLKNIGTIQMQYDKIYLPGYNRNLLPVDMGRVIYSREF